MSRRIGILGAGHLAGYLVEGFRRRRPDWEILVSDIDAARAQGLAARWGVRAAADNQALVDQSDPVILAVRPADAVPACGSLQFRPGQKLASAAAGVTVAELSAASAPAEVVRVMPLTSASINLSPTLTYPADPVIAEIFSAVGQVHAVPDEAAFTAASVIAAFYGWVYALADETVAWTERQGVPAETARKLVLETLRSTAEMSLVHPEQSLRELLALLATPGGITEYGLGLLQERHGLDAWTPALDGVLARLRR